MKNNSCNSHADTSFSAYLVRLRRHLHQNPELSGQEIGTSRFIKNELDQLHIPWSSLGETDVEAQITGDIGRQNPSCSPKTVLLRADMDALPVTEQSQISYASRTPGVMHACGHDAHTAMLLGAAKLLQDQAHGLKGTVRLVFQPAEETGGATRSLIKNGLLDGADTAFSLHVAPDLPTGKISITNGACMAGVDDFTISISGTGGHGAAPHLGTDVLLAGAHLAVNLQEIVSREMNPLDPVVVTIGTFHAGTKVNILAKDALLSGNIRFFNRELRDCFPSVLKRYADHTAAMFRCSAGTRYTPSLLPVINHPDCCNAAKDAARKVWGSPNWIEKPPCTTSEDFSRYLDILPGVMVFLGTNDGTRRTSYALHHECFDLDENALENGSRLYAQYALDWLEQV